MKFCFNNLLNPFKLTFLLYSTAFANVANTINTVQVNKALFIFLLIPIHESKLMLD